MLRQHLAALALVLAAFAAPHRATAQALLGFSSVSGATGSPIEFIVRLQQGDGVLANCSACVTVNGPASVAGVYDLAIQAFDVGSLDFLPNTFQTSQVYSQHFSGPCVVDVTTPSSELLAAGCNLLTIFATPGASTAVFQFELTLSTVQTGPIIFPSGPLYLIVAGSTTTPVSTNAFVDPINGQTYTSFDGITLDWSAYLSQTPYSPGAFVSVPNVVGATQANASSTLQASGLTIGTVSMMTSSTVAAGAIISEVPAAGVNVPAGWPVNLAVSSGGPPVTVPQVVGLSQGAAVSRIEAAGLSVVAVTAQPSSTVPAGTVISENPPASSSVASGSAVSLVVSLGTGLPPGPTSYHGDGTSSFNYNLYLSPPSLVEAFITSTENNSASPYEAFFSSIGAGAIDVNGNPAVWQLHYIDQAQAIQCTGSYCYETLQGSGTLTVFDVNSCPLVANPNSTPGNPLPNVPNIGTSTCSYTQGSLAGGYITTSGNLASLAANQIDQATLQFVYTPTQSGVAGSGITTTYSGVAPYYVYVTGNSVGPVFGDPGTPTTPAPVPLCYTNQFNCNAVTPPAVPTGLPFYNAFGVDWAGTLSATPYILPGSSITVPNVVGDTESTAAATLASSGLVLGTVTTHASTSVASGLVVSEAPAAGSGVADGSAVNLVISSGPPSVVVPAVTGDSQSAASIALTSAGLTVGAITTQNSASVAAGSVISESPAAGSSVAAGTAVDLVVSSGALRGDINGDGQVNKLDLALITAVLNTPAAGNDPRDLNHDGVINALDARIEVTLCTHPGCAIN